MICDFQQHTPTTTTIPSPLSKKRRLEEPLPNRSMYRLTPTESLHIFDGIELCQLLDERSDNLLFQTHAGDIQRNVDVAHLNELKQFQHHFCEQNGYYSFSTQMVVAEYNGKYALVDGQHRLETIRYLLEVDFDRAATIKVPVLTVQLRCVNEYDEVFTAINKNKPVALYKNVCDWKTVGKHLEKYLMTNYYTYIKQTPSPQVPHINVQALLTYIDDGDYIKTAGLTYEEWVHELEALNTCYRLHWKELLHNTRYIGNITNWADKCECKHPARPLYLGVFRKFEWIDRILLKVQTPGATYLQMKHVPFNFRVKISKPMRRSVWKKRNAESLVGSCYACSKHLHYDDFECGHIVSVFSGGETTVGNLEPICRMCNSDMGVDHLETFKSSLETMHQ